MQIYDISLEIHENMLVYPGNVEPKIMPVKRMPGDSANLSKIILGSHTGTHVDTMRHVYNGGMGLEGIPLESFYGDCKVFDLMRCETAVDVKDLMKLDITSGDIILLKTKNSIKGYSKFNRDFIHLTEKAADFLISRKIKTLGVDYLSVQKYHSGTQDIHEKIIANMVLFEGLDLKSVEGGRYLFIGLPLRVKDADGAPARAMLMEL